MDIKPAWLNKVALAILRIGLTPPEGAEGPGRRKSSAPETEKKNKVRHGTERCMAANKDDLEFCRRGVDRRRWRRGILLLVCRPSIKSTLACPGYGSTRPSPRAAAGRRTTARMAFRAERRGKLRGQVWVRETIV